MIGGCGVALLFISPVAARIIDFSEVGGSHGSKVSTDTAKKNTKAFNSALTSLTNGDTLLVPNKTFTMMGGIVAIGLQNVTIQIDGTLSFSDDIKAWPKKKKKQKGSEMPVTAMEFVNCSSLTLTSSGMGTLNGNGAKWWGIPGIGYLLRGKNRPPLMSMTRISELVVEKLLFLNSPRFNFISSMLIDATIRYCEVSARRTSEDGHGNIDLTAFNTDGFDVAGRNIHVHDVTVWNQDDTVAIKADKNMVTENVLVENVHASGVGLTIGSIGSDTVRNITFRNVLMHHTSKGVYVKFRSSAAQGGSISDVVYENILIDKPSSWPIWIGPAQQDIKQKSGPSAYNPCHGDPCSLCWPKVPFSNCDSPAGLFANITLRNITILKPKLSPGVIFGNSTNPIRGLVFDGVRVKDPPSDGSWGKKYYFCKGVASGIAKGDTWPVPPCFEDHTEKHVDLPVVI
jgi:polygalacturonase